MIALLFYLAQVETHATQPGYFAPVALTLLIIGGLMWLVAVVLGYGRARSMGGAAKWFARSAVCLLIYHLQFLMLGVIAVIEFRRNKSDYGMMLNVGAFFNLFIMLAALCAIIGFMNLKAEKTEAPPESSD
jgi:hypothetical protein